MFHTLYDLLSFDAAAVDGEIGNIIDFYFDDQSWKIRYLVLDTGNWLSGRQVLIAANALGRPDLDTRRLPVKLTKKQIEDSPPVETDLPVSRQREAQLFDHYGWPYYWQTIPALAATAPLPPMTIAAETTAADGDPRLRSVREVTGYYIAARDGDIGHVEDLIGDLERWELPFFVIDTRNWLPGRKVVVATASIAEVDWADRRVRVALERATIKDSPPYHPDQPLDADASRALLDHYAQVGGHPPVA